MSRPSTLRRPGVPRLSGPAALAALTCATWVGCGGTVSEGDGDGEPADDDDAPAPLDPEFVDAPAGYVPDLGATPTDVVSGDVDGDGDPDLLLAMPPDGVVLLLNSGFGGFALPAEGEFALPPWAGDARRLVLADLNDDGRLDLFACHGRGERDRLAWGAADGLVPADDRLPGLSTDCRDALATDLDGDGVLDLAILARDADATGAGRSAVRVLRGSGGGFAPHDGLEWPATVADLPVPGPELSGGVSLTFVEDGAGAGDGTSGSFAWAGREAGDAVRAAFPVRSRLAPIAFRATISGAPGDATVLVRLIDASGERFEHELSPQDGALRVADLAAATPTGGDGDGLVTAPLQSVAIGLRLAGGDDGAMRIDDLVLETADGGEILVEDFERPDLALAAPPGESSLLAADIDGDGRPDLVASRTSGGGPPLRVLLARPGAADASDGAVGFDGSEGLAPSALDGLKVPRVLPIRLEDGGGPVDLFLVVRDGQDRALRNDGEGRFFDDTVAALPVESADGREALRADLDRDGRAEVVVVNDGAADRILHPDGAGRLVDWTARAPIELDRSTQVVALDVEGDGDVDLVTWGPGRAPRMLVAVPR